MEERKVIVSYAFELLSGFGGDGFQPDRLRFTCAETGELYEIELIAMKWQKKTDFLSRDEKQPEKDFLYYVQNEQGDRRILLMRGRQRTIFTDISSRKVIRL